MLMIRNPTRISSTKLRQQSKEYMLFCMTMNIHSINTMPNQTAVLYNQYARLYWEGQG